MYAIVTGCYSDYRIEKVTNDYLLAQQYCAYKNSEDSEYLLGREYAYRIEELDLLEDVFQCEDRDFVYNYKVTLAFDRNQYGLKVQYSSNIVMLRSNSKIFNGTYNGYEFKCYGRDDKSSYITVYNVVVDKEDEELAAAIALERAYVMLYELDCNITEDRVRLYDIMLSGHKPVMSVTLVIKFTVDDEFVIKNIEIDSRESYRWLTDKELVDVGAGTVSCFRRIENKDIEYFLKMNKKYDDLDDVESDEDIFHYFKNIISEPKAVKNIINDIEKAEGGLVRYGL